MYIPQGAVSLDKIPSISQIRMGIQGFPGTGKTYGSLTFPNPIVFNLDRGLGAHYGRADVIEVPAWNEEYLKTINPKYKAREDLKDTIQIWVEKEAKKLEAEQTLVFDGGTALQSAYNAWISENRPVTKSGEFDEYAPWRLKIAYFEEIMETFKILKCHVIYLCHESEKADKGGIYSGKIRPLLTGQFQDQLASHFTDWFRQHSTEKILMEKVDEKILKAWGMTNPKEFISMQNEFPGNTIYFWQTEGDSIFDAKRSSLKPTAPKFIQSNFPSFMKYMKGETNQTKTTK
jgi:hypothetical protein